MTTARLAVFVAIVAGAIGFGLGRLSKEALRELGRSAAQVLGLLAVVLAVTFVLVGVPA